MHVEFNLDLGSRNTKDRIQCQIAQYHKIRCILIGPGRDRRGHKQTISKAPLVIRVVVCIMATRLCTDSVPHTLTALISVEHHLKHSPALLPSDKKKSLFEHEIIKKIISNEFQESDDT